MSVRLEHEYENELAAIRHLAKDFAREHPAVAGRLILSDDTGLSQDPHVERLIEAFAFLTARLQVKLKDEFPELVDALLGMLYPHYLAPIPSMAIAQLHLDRGAGQPDDRAGRFRGDRAVLARDRRHAVPVSHDDCR